MKAYFWQSEVSDQQNYEWRYPTLKKRKLPEEVAKKGGDESGESDANPQEWPNKKMSQNETIQQSNLIPICRNFAAFHPFHWSIFQELPIPKIQEELLFPAGGYLMLDGQSLRSSGEKTLKKMSFW